MWKTWAFGVRSVVSRETVSFKAPLHLWFSLWHPLQLVTPYIVATLRPRGLSSKPAHLTLSLHSEGSVASLDPPPSYCMPPPTPKQMPSLPPSTDNSCPLPHGGPHCQLQPKPPFSSSAEDPTVSGCLDTLVLSPRGSTLRKWSRLCSLQYSYCG